MAKKPWFKFNPTDWRDDERLRMCSMAARGLWIELLCVMDRAEQRGHLLIAGRRPSVPQIAAQVACSAEECGPLLRELEEHEVFSRTRDGTIFSRKMVRDSHISATGRQAVEKRWGAENADDFGGATDQPNRRLTCARDQSPESRDSEDQNPEDQSPDSARACARAIWDDSPVQSRKRSALAKVEEALQAARKRGRNLAVIRRAVAAYFMDPDVAKEDYRWAKGLHRVIQNDFWETWAQAEGVEHLDRDAEARLERQMFENWALDPHDPQWGPPGWREHPPGDPACRISAAVMAEYGYEAGAEVTDDVRRRCAASRAKRYRERG